jgi:hypothetical protein
VHVDLSHNHIVSVTNSAFASQAMLKQLRLDSNKIGRISNTTFVGLSKLEILSLRNNEVEALPDNLFAHSPLLQRLDLARNRIAEVSDRAFGGLESLRILHLEDNFLNFVPTEAFRLIPSLAELYLSGNPLSTVPANAFLPFRTLTLLDLTSCRLGSVDDLGFRGLGTLRRLKLTDNNLTEVPTVALRSFPGLRGLDLGRNPYESIKPNALRFLSKLKHLDVSGCSRLTDIESSAFGGCVDLEYVTVSLNKNLARIAGDAFDAVPALRHLNLADNKLRHLPETLVPWRNLRSLDLSGNPWQCDCDLSFVPQVLKHLREKAEQGLNATGDSSNGAAGADATEAPNSVAQVVAGSCAGPEGFQSVSLHDFKAKCAAGGGFGTATTLSDFQDGVTRDDFDVLRDNNATAVVVSVSVVVVVLVLAATLFVCVKCRNRYRDWAKRYRLWRHSSEASPAASSTASAATKSSGSLRRPPQYADHFYYPSPYRQPSAGSSQGHYSPYSPYYSSHHHHQQQQHHHGTVASDDEYYYVSTSLRGNGDASAKHIPVTVL